MNHNSNPTNLVDFSSYFAEKYPEGTKFGRIMRNIANRDSLNFTVANEKLIVLAKYMGLKKTEVLQFDLPAGWTCPAADQCLARTNRITGVLKDGPHQKYRCYAASNEARCVNVRGLRWKNFEILTNVVRKGGNANDIADRIYQDLLACGAKVVRIHSSGDFYSEMYFQAWVIVANRMPDVMFFGYTKVAEYVAYPKPENFALIYSHGGKNDQLALDLGLPTCYVVNNREQADKIGVNIICDNSENDYQDFAAIFMGQSFALLVHGTQPKKTK